MNKTIWSSELEDKRPDLIGTDTLRIWPESVDPYNRDALYSWHKAKSQKDQLTNLKNVLAQVELRLELDLEAARIRDIHISKEACFLRMELDRMTEFLKKLERSLETLDVMQISSLIHREKHHVNTMNEYLADPMNKADILYDNYGKLQKRIEENVKRKGKPEETGKGTLRGEGGFGVSDL